MRVISGSAKGIKLAEFKGDSIRPTADRVREAVFSSLNSQFNGFVGKKVLELFAGTGAMSIEALSRGAAKAVMIDESRDAEELIKRNLATAGVSDRALFKRGNVHEILSRLAVDGPFDLIILDPPYAKNNIETIITDLIHFGLVQSDGIICIETSSKTVLDDTIGNMISFNRRKYGSTLISYYRFSEAEAGLS